MSPAVAVSDVAGVAESGEWLLGSPGVQRLVARAGQLASEAFTAKATAPPFTCDPVGALPMQTTFRSELTPLSCQSGDGRSGESYTIVVTEANAYVFSATSAEFDTDLELRGAGVEVATNDDLSATTNSAIKALLVPGTYTLSVSSSQVGGGGSYTVSYQPATANVVGCEEAFIVRGVTARGVVEYSDCTLSPNEYSDRFRIYLEAGAQVQVQVRDFSYAGPNVEIDGPDGSTARGGPSGNYLTTLVYSAAVAGYYTVLVGLTGEYDIQYEITVR